MKIWDDWITCLRGDGYLTLQVPEICLGGPSITIDVPDSWFWYLKAGRPAVGREQGFLHISPEGFQANKKALAAAYLGSLPNDQQGLESAETFYAWADAHYAEVKETALRVAARGSCPSLRAIRIREVIKTFYGE